MMAAPKTLSRNAQSRIARLVALGLVLTSASAITAGAQSSLADLAKQMAEEKEAAEQRQALPEPAPTPSATNPAPAPRTIMLAPGVPSAPAPAQTPAPVQVSQAAGEADGDYAEMAAEMRAAGMSEAQIQATLDRVRAAVAAAPQPSMGGLSEGPAMFPGGRKPSPLDIDPEDRPDVDSETYTLCADVHHEVIRDVVDEVRPGATLLQFVSSCQVAAMQASLISTPDGIILDKSAMGAIEDTASYWQRVNVALHDRVREQMLSLLDRYGVSEAEFERYLADSGTVSEAVEQAMDSVYDEMLLVSVESPSSLAGEAQGVWDDCNAVQRRAGARFTEIYNTDESYRGLACEFIRLPVPDEPKPKDPLPRE